MKFIVLIGDGMGDYPLDELGGRTVLEAANTPNMDWIADQGRGGLMQTIPESQHPGSDVANMEIMGFDTTKAFTGRAVFEALSMGKHLAENDVAFRANLVTLEDGVMRDYSAGHVTTEEADELIKAIDDSIGTESHRFYTGVSYRHLMIWEDGADAMETTPPHDIIDQKYAPHLPKGEGADTVLGIMDKSREVLADQLVNKKREASGKLPANSLWLWGQGRRLELETIEQTYGLKGGVISAVDLIKGIGVAAGLKPVFVPGATGYVDTNYKGKAENALKALETMDFIYLHVEAPDEAGHNGSVEMKIQAIEDFDELVVGTILESIRSRDDLAAIVACDHRTPVSVRTHTREPIPFAYYGPGVTRDGMRVYSERGAEEGDIDMISAHNVLKLFIGDFIDL